MSIQRLLLENKIETPCYLFNIPLLKKHISEIKKNQIHLIYAMKANPFIVKEMDELVNGIEVCSLGELDICKKNNIPGEHIIFSGINKTENDIKKALDYNVDFITIESLRQLDLLIQQNKKIKVLLRITNNSQFGLDLFDIEKIIAERKKYPSLIIKGFHFYSTTQKKKNLQELKELINFINNLNIKYNYQTQILEYGAGWPAPYFEGEDFNNVYSEFNNFVSEIKELKTNFPIVLELGRFLTYNCGQYITTINDIKCNNGFNYAIVDGGIHHLNYINQNLGMKVPKIDLIQKKSYNNIKKSKWTVCGSLCTMSDVLVRNFNVENLEIGDVLVFNNAGAYSLMESPVLFLNRKLPKIYKLYEK